MSCPTKHCDKEHNGNGNGNGWKSKSTHHRKPRSIGGTEEERNRSELPISRHRAWHTLFQNWTPQRIAREITDRYLDPDYKMVVVKKREE